MEAQAPICPFCCDDHSSNTECDERELRKIMLKTEFDHLMESFEPKHEKHDGGLIERFKRMIDWL